MAFCPLIKEECKEEGCAWWIIRKGCAVWKTGKELENIGDELQNITNEIDSLTRNR